jgi:acetyltransferase-like isoleucine patch superfamily enzyme
VIRTMRAIVRRLRNAASIRLGGWYRHRQAIEFGPGASLHSGVSLVNGVGPRSRLVLGAGSYVDDRSEIDVSDSVIHVGDGTFIHKDACIYGDVSIGEWCLVSKRFFVSSGSHDMQGVTYIRYNDSKARGSHSKPVEIDDDVWIGCGVFVKAGVSVGKGAVVGAGSVVTRDVAPYDIVGGVPARRLGSRAEFNPPSELLAGEPLHLPYFYSGFRQRFSESQDLGYELSRCRCRLMLPRGWIPSEIRMSGFSASSVVVKGKSSNAGVTVLGEFDLTLQVSDSDVQSIAAGGKALVLDWSCEEGVRLRRVVFL